MRKWLIGGVVIVILIIAGLIFFFNMQPRIPGYLLPLPDYRGPETAPAALEGRITGIDASMITVKKRDASSNIVIAINKETKFFSYGGETVKREALAVGQYVWVWFVTRDPAKAGNPPRAALVMPFSKDPNT